MNQRWLAILVLGIGVGLSACSDDSEGGGGDGGGGDDSGGSGGTSGSTGTGGSGGTSGSTGTGGSGGTSGTGGLAGTEVIHCVVEDDMGAVTGCEDLTTPQPAVDAVRQQCEDDGGTVVDACPSAGRVGRCALVMGALVIHYYEPDDPADAEGMCADFMGTWTDG